MSKWTIGFALFGWAILAACGGAPEERTSTEAERVAVPLTPPPDAGDAGDAAQPTSEEDAGFDYDPYGQTGYNPRANRPGRADRCIGNCGKHPAQ